MQTNFFYQELCRVYPYKYFISPLILPVGYKNWEDVYKEFQLLSYRAREANNRLINASKDLKILIYSYFTPENINFFFQSKKIPQNKLFTDPNSDLWKFLYHRDISFFPLDLENAVIIDFITFCKKTPKVKKTFNFPLIKFYRSFEYIKENSSDPSSEIHRNVTYELIYKIFIKIRRGTKALSLDPFNVQLFYAVLGSEKNVQKNIIENDLFNFRFNIVEKIVLNNKGYILEALGLDTKEITCDLQLLIERGFSAVPAGIK